MQFLLVPFHCTRSRLNQILLTYTQIFLSGKKKIREKKQVVTLEFILDGLIPKGRPFVFM